MPCALVVPSCLEEPSLAPIYFLNEGHFTSVVILTPSTPSVVFIIFLF